MNPVIVTILLIMFLLWVLPSGKPKVTTAALPIIVQQSSSTDKKGWGMEVFLIVILGILYLLGTTGSTPTA